MADLSDVLNALVSLVNGVFYPTPPASGNSSVTNTPVKIYPGWPVPDQLNTDLRTEDQNGNLFTPALNVSVFAMPGSFENVTRYPEDWRPVCPLPSATLTIAVSGVTATIGGTVSTPQNVALIVDRKAYAYGVQPTDTISTIATALAAMANEDQPATANGPVITIPDSHSIIGRVGIVGTVTQEVMRVRQRFMISFWCPTPLLRDTASAPVKLAIALTRFLTLPDGYGARLLFVGDNYSDEREKLLIYRRDLIVTVEYATTNTETVSQIIVPQVQMTSAIEQPLDTETGQPLDTESGAGIALEDPSLVDITF